MANSPIETVFENKFANPDIYAEHDSEGNKSTGRAINDDIVMASVLAVLDSINKLLLIKRSLY